MKAVPRPKGDKPSAEAFIADFSEGFEAGLYLALLELLDEGLIITGDEVVLEANSAACRLLERDYRELAGQPLANIFPSERAFLDARARLFIQGEMRGSLQVSLPGGRHRDLRFIAAARLRPGIHALILSPDVIAEAYIEGDRAATRSDMRTDVRTDVLWPRLAAALEQPVLVVDEDGLVSAANAVALATLGVERNAFVGHPLTSHFDISWPHTGHTQIAMLHRHGKPQAVSARVLPGPKPGWRVLVLPASPPPSAVQSAPSTTQQTAPATAVTGNTFFEQVFADSPLPTFLCEGPDMRIFAANIAAERVYGHSREALCRLRMTQLRADPDSTARLPERGVWRQRRSDGVIFDAEILAYPVTLPGHSDALAVMHDVPHQPLLSTRKQLPDGVIKAASQAIDRDQLEVHFQPLVDARTGTIRSGEALLRWHHPALGLIPFRRFMNVARSGGLLADMGDWVLNVACGYAASWPDTRGTVPGLTVNIASEQLIAGRLPETIRNALRLNKLPGHRLELDLEEQVLSEDRSHIASTLASIRTLGVTLAIDGFGRGLSSIPRLKRYPLSAIKLDPALISEVGRLEESEAIVEAIASMAGVLGLDVLARGVESSAQQAFLSALGCHLQQGPLFGPPMTPAEFRALLDGNVRGTARVQ